jgi:hypothetical protein
MAHRRDGRPVGAARRPRSRAVIGSGTVAAIARVAANCGPAGTGRLALIQIKDARDCGDLDDSIVESIHLRENRGCLAAPF